MRKLADVISDKEILMLPATATVREACCSMRDHHVGAVMVVNEKQQPVGIFTGRDAVYRILAENRSPAKTPLSKVMSPAPSCLTPDKYAIEALRLMRMGGFRHVPIIDNGKLVGIVSRADFAGIEVDRLEEEVALWEKI